MTGTDLSGLFDPDRVAVVGATDRRGSVGRALMVNLSTFDGGVVPVNPDRETVPTPAGGVAGSASEAEAIAEGIGEPVVMKVLSPDIPHKSDAVVETIQRVSQLVTDFPAIDELDLNPLVAAPDGVCAVDLRLTVDGDELSLPGSDDGR